MNGARVTLGRILAAGALALAGAGAAEGASLRVGGEPSRAAFDRQALSRQRSELAARLASERAAGAEGRQLLVAPTPEALAALERGEPRYKVGVVAATGLPVLLGGASAAFGALERRAGGWVWSGVLESAGAVALRLRFAEVDLPRGAALALYSDRGQAFEYRDRGPGGSGDFWSHTIIGSRVTVQLSVPDAAAVPRVVLAEIGHLTDRFGLGVLGRAPEVAPLCSFNADCVVNAACESLPRELEYTQAAVAQILFASGGLFYICSGGLLADTAGSEIPYFLTAHHCLKREQEADTVEVFFHFATPCNGRCYEPVGQMASTLGAAVRATNRSGDFTLLELDEAAPAGSAFLGWTTTPVAFANGTPLYRIGHPGGAPQAYSEHRVDTAKVTCGSWPRGDWIYSADLVGAAEGGSSGSPLLNGSGEVVGQLSGVCGFAVDDPCDAASNATVDGAFANYFDELEPFLAGD